ncbi:helix-turn-helix transcriptional regulator [Sneathiella aquimaris]|uniref:helix-turn-helix transcriptional regulator n=1 Tax=Sneathiella aquimaris TaxID=2599305 RepID=UPI00146CF01C|nr:hypothetical protein [Sneathiella aquimaris]
MSSKYLTRKQVAECYPISFSNLAHLAHQGRGVRYRIIGKNAVYRVDDIEAWLEQQVIEPTKGRRGRPRKSKKRQKSLVANDNDQ